MDDGMDIQLSYRKCKEEIFSVFFMARGRIFSFQKWERSSKSGTSENKNSSASIHYFSFSRDVIYFFLYSDKIVA